MAKQPLTEVKAMKVVDDALAGLEPEARNRVLAWASSKHHANLAKPGAGSDSEDNDIDAEGQPSPDYS